MGAGESISALLAFIIPLYAKLRYDKNDEIIDIRPNLTVLIILILIQIFLYFITGISAFI
jgi:hypothetical protein